MTHDHRPDTEPTLHLCTHCQEYDHPIGGGCDDCLAVGKQQIASRIVAAIERVVTEQALNTPLNREALIAVVLAAAMGRDEGGTG